MSKIQLNLHLSVSFFKKYYSTVMYLVIIPWYFDIMVLDTIFIFHDFYIVLKGTKQNTMILGVNIVHANTWCFGNVPW